MSGHQKIIALQIVINNSLWIFHIARIDCSLYNKQKIHGCLKIPDLATSRVEHLNMTFTPGCIPCIQHAEFAPRQNLSTPHFINNANKLSNMPPVTESPSVRKRI